MKRCLLFSALMGLAAVSASAQGLDTLQLKTIFMEPYLAGVRPSLQSFTDDGKKIVFSWNENHTSGNERWEVDLTGKNLRKLETPQRGQGGPGGGFGGFGGFGGPNTSPDGKYQVVSERGDLYIEDANGENRRVLTALVGNESNATWSSDSKYIAFVNNGDVWVVGVDKPEVRQVTRKKEEEPNYSIQGFGMGGKRLIVTQTDMNDVKEYYFPSYVGHFVTPGASRRGFGITTVSEVNVDSMKTKKLYTGMYRTSYRGMSPSDRYFLIDRTDVAQKKRDMMVYDFDRGTLNTIFADSTQGWLSGYSSEFFDKKDQILFTSEKDGWNHIYTVNVDGSGMKQHTRGGYEIDWYEWLSDDSLILASTEVDPGERHLYTLNLGNDQMARLTMDEAFRKNFRLSPDKKTVVYARTFWNQPDDLYALDIAKKAETRLTDTAPDRFKAVNWQVPQYHRFKGRDGETMLSMTVLKPQNMQAGRKYPVVVFVHGAGSLQNVYKGWSNNYYREYMFHQFLNQQGYVVIEVDYRHSLGYGRKFREDVTNWMGKYETEDIVDGLDFIAKDGYADMDRVGIYGGSYGGFMALYAVSAEPDRVHAGAALRAVTNWENYFWTNPGYTWPRLGHPDVDTLNYQRSSPLSFADTLRRPVYILHGLIDDNVGFQDAVQYVERLVQTGNPNFEMMMYPSERHSFTDPDSWFDEYRRIFHFFEREVKNRDIGASAGK